MNVGELRKLLADLSDNLEVVTGCETAGIGAVHRLVGSEWPVTFKTQDGTVLRGVSFRAEADYCDVTLEGAKYR